MKTIKIIALVVALGSTLCCMAEPTVHTRPITLDEAITLAEYKVSMLPWH